MWCVSVRSRGEKSGKKFGRKSNIVAKGVTMKGTAIVWFRNDLRIKDHQSLFDACQSHQKVLAYYVFDPELYKNTPYGFKKTGAFRTQFLIETLKELQQALLSLNISLVVSHNPPHFDLPNLIKKHEATHVYMQKEWTTEEFETLKKVQANCSSEIVFVENYEQFLFHPNDIPFDLDQLPEIFTVFRKKCEATVRIRPLVSDAKPMPKSNLLPQESPIPTLQSLGFETPPKDPRTSFPFSGGMLAGQARMRHYGWESQKLSIYKKTRNGLLGTDYSSKYSAWLANGSLSPKMIYWDLKSYENQIEKNESTYWLFFELVWRDYFKFISLKHQNHIFLLGGIKNRDYPWKSDPTLLKQWIEGQTPEPFVNANMLELKQTGWMSNRGRQNVASYFCKNMFIDWRMGAAYFEAMLIDYDVHSNYGNWMYVAGVGNDPRDRKFNIPLQAERYDPSGLYQKKWLQTKLLL